MHRGRRRRHLASSFSAEHPSPTPQHLGPPATPRLRALNRPVSPAAPAPRRQQPRHSPAPVRCGRQVLTLSLEKPSRKRPPDGPAARTQPVTCGPRRARGRPPSRSPSPVPRPRCSCSSRPAGGGALVPEREGVERGEAAPRRRRLLPGLRWGYYACASCQRLGGRGLRRLRGRTLRMRAAGWPRR